jgi:hypothetical protein
MINYVLTIYLILFRKISKIDLLDFKILLYIYIYILLQNTPFSNTENTLTKKKKVVVLSC